MASFAGEEEHVVANKHMPSAKLSLQPRALSRCIHSWCLLAPCGALASSLSWPGPVVPRSAQTPGKPCRQLHLMPTPCSLWEVWISALRVGGSHHPHPHPHPVLHSTQLTALPWSCHLSPPGAICHPVSRWQIGGLGAGARRPQADPRWGRWCLACYLAPGLSPPP